MSTHFAHEFCDPEGRLVVLHDRLWHAEIQRDHPILRGHLEAVRETVESPDVICEDADFPERDCYYRQGAVQRYPRYWLKVVVEPSRDDPDSGHLLTAFIVDAIKGTETERWRKND